MSSVSSVSLNSTSKLLALLKELESEIATSSSKGSTSGFVEKLKKEVSELESEISGISSVNSTSGSASGSSSDTASSSATGSATTNELAKALKLIEDLLSTLAMDITPAANIPSLIQTSAQSSSTAAIYNTSNINALV